MASPGRIHVGEAACTLPRDRSELEERGVVDVKGKGPMRTWFLVRERTASSSSVVRAPLASAGPVAVSSSSA